MLLDYNFDINVVDEQLPRTIFYQFLFDKVSQYPTPAMSDQQTLKFDDSVYEKMIQLYQPEVNYIDTITGMTPLELAIHERNKIMIEVCHYHSG